MKITGDTMETRKRELVGWCENDSCGEPIYLPSGYNPLSRPIYCKACIDASERADIDEIDSATIEE